MSVSSINIYKPFSLEPVPSPVWALTRSLSKGRIRTTWHSPVHEFRIYKTPFRKINCVEWTVLCAIIPSVVTVGVKM